MSHTQEALLTEEATKIVARWDTDIVTEYATSMLVIQLMQQPRLLEELTKFVCGECEELRVDDDRVIAGMKCGVCAY